MKIDQPLKYFLAITLVFLILFSIIILATISNNPHSVTSFQVVSPTDSLIIRAEQKALLSIDTFHKYHHLNSENSFVKYKVKTKQGYNHIWGRVVILKDDHITIETQELDNDINSSPAILDLSIDQVEDWLIEMKNGKILGGFTTQVLLLYEKQQNRDSVAIDSQMMLFEDGL